MDIFSDPLGSFLYFCSFCLICFLFYLFGESKKGNNMQKGIVAGVAIISFVSCGAHYSDQKKTTDAQSTLYAYQATSTVYFLRETMAVNSIKAAITRVNESNIEGTSAALDATADIDPDVKTAIAEVESTRQACSKDAACWYDSLMYKGTPTPTKELGQ